MAVPRTRLARLLQSTLALALMVQMLPAGVGPIAPAAAQVPGTSPAFGAPGLASWTNYDWDGSPEGAQEPSIGVPWNLPGGVDAAGNPNVGTSAFYRALHNTYRLDFDDSVNPPALIGGTPALVSDLNLQDLQNGGLNDGVDPILFTDQQTGRTFSGELHINRVQTPVAAANQAQNAMAMTGCSVMSFTDGNGRDGNSPSSDDWTPVADPCSLPGWDHQTIASGPYPINYVPTNPVPLPPVPGAAPVGQGLTAYPNGVYYCSQDPTANGNRGAMHCWVSEDGGITFRPAGEVDPGSVCRGLHGKMRIAPDGTAYLPNGNCNGLTGMAVTQDFGRTWSIRTLPFTNSGSGVWDPSIAPTKESGWIYVAQAEQAFPSGCLCVALSKDGGLTWEDVGQGNGALAGEKYFDIAQQLFGGCCIAFPNVVAGDDERAAVTFLGSTAPFRSPVIYQCNQPTLHWKLYAALTYDAGKTWSITQVDKDLVQNDGLFAAGTSTGAPNCRNHLDFYDSTIDAYGRVLVGYTDGCTGPCGVNGGVLPGQPSADRARSVLARQTTGCGLLEQFDAIPGACINQVGVPPNPCGTTDDPAILFQAPHNNQVVEVPEFQVRGVVERNPHYPRIYAHTSGPYSGLTQQPVAIDGWSSCGTGNGATGTFTCAWTPLGGHPVISPSTTSCKASITYQFAGSYPLQLMVTDRVSGFTGTIVTTVNVNPSPGGGGGGGGGGGNGTTPPIVRTCLDNSTVGPEPDDDQDVSTFGLAATGYTDASIFEIFDVCADEQSSNLVIEIRANLAGSPAGVDSTVQYLLYLDTTNTPFTADPTVLVSMTTSGPIAYLPPDPATGASGTLPPGSAVYAYDPATGPVPTTGKVTVTIPLSSPFLVNPPGAHTVGVSVGDGPYMANYPGPFLSWAWVGVGPQVYAGQATLITCCADSAPDAFATITASCSACTTQNAHAAAITSSATGAAPSVPAPQIPAGNGAPVGTILLPPIGNAASQAQGAAGSVAGTAQGLAQGAVGTVQGAVGSLGAPAPVQGVANQATAAANAALGTLFGQIQSLNLAALVNTIPQSQGTTMAATVSGAGTTPTGAREYVRVRFDWGLTAYQAVNTVRPGFPNDVWGFNITGVDSSLNGMHIATATWFDSSGQVVLAMDNVTFFIDVPGSAPDNQPKGPRDPPSDGTNSYHQGTDADSDGIDDYTDNCPSKANPLQEDLDSDGTGNVCDPDADGDQVPNGIDNCPVKPNPDQAITHFPNPDGVGDACNEDWDGDGVRNTRDLCPKVPDPAQKDEDLDRIGDACDQDAADPSLGTTFTELGLLPEGAIGPGIPTRQAATVRPEEKAESLLGAAGTFGLAVGVLLVVFLALLMMRKRDG